MNFLFLVYRLIKPVVDPLRLIKGITRYVPFIIDCLRYSRLQGAEPIHVVNLIPSLYNKTDETRFDPHYFYQDIWAFKKILDSGVDSHVDVGSRIDFVGFLTTVMKVNFIDIRPLLVDLENFNSRKGSILSMPFEDNSIQSLSCLHVAEHIGLGRYGDSLDPLGTKKACRELTRVLAKDGSLYFSLPIGKPRLCFNAHRIHSPRQITEYFSGLKLVEFSGVDDKKNFIRNVNMSILENSDYACGLFHFRKK